MQILKMLLNVLLVSTIALLLSLSDVSAEVVNQNQNAISGWNTKDYITICIAIAGFLLGLTNTSILVHSGRNAVFGSMGAGYKHQTFRKSYDYWNYNFLEKYNDLDSFESK